MSKRKARLTKHTSEIVANDDENWSVKYGELKRGKGNPGTDRLFKVVGEKIPYSALVKVSNHLKNKRWGRRGVYIAHDSMGCPRYVGRGNNVFSRLWQHKRAHRLELEYFSFYLLDDKKHEGEIETLLIRASGFLLEFNERKKRVSISHGNIRDYEAGTHFYERHYKKGKKTR